MPNLSYLSFCRNSDEFRSSIFIWNLAFNGGSPRCNWGLKGIRCSSSAGRNLPTRSFSHCLMWRRRRLWEFLRKWEVLECWRWEKSVPATKMADICRGMSPTAIYTHFNANITVTTANFWNFLVQRRVIIDYQKVIIDYCFKGCVKYESWRVDNR